MAGLINWSDITGIIIPIGTLVVGSVVWITKMFSDVKSELSAFKQEVAKDYASMATLEKFEDRLMAAIDKLGDRLDRRT